MASRRTLKCDSLGAVHLEYTAAEKVVVRDVARASWSVRWLARHLARREARALKHLATETRVPDLLAFDGIRLRRSFLAGLPLHHAAMPTRSYFKDAIRLLARLHRHGVAHNDLAKEANWLKTRGEGAAIVDFQLAVVSRRRGPWFRMLAREDLRHLLKHKAHYLPESLTKRQREMLSRPALPARLWRRLAKPVYRLVTRRVLRWPEREGAEERQRGNAPWRSGRL